MITAAKPLEISIQDVGAIQDVTIPIARGTIVRLVGNNGAGKSTAIKAVASAITKENAGLRPRDGRMSGKVRMPGVTVSIGARMSRKATGEESPVTFAVVEDGTGIAKILNPGLKDAVAADKRRLEGVLDVIGATLSVETIQKYLGSMYEEFVKARDIKGKGFVDSVKEMKLFLESKARDIGLTITQCDGALAEIGTIANREYIADVFFGGATTVEELAKQVEDLALEVRDAVRDREKSRQALETLSQTETDYKIDATLAEIETLNASIKTDENEIASIDAEILALNEKRAGYASDLSLRKAERTMKQEIVRIGQEAEKRNQELKAQIAGSITDEVLQAKQSELEKLREGHAEAIKLKSANDHIESQKTRLAEIQAKRADAEKQHGALKTLAHGTSDLLREELKQVPGWTVDDDMRLCVEHKRGRIPFDELSPGEGTARVCLLSCQFSHVEEGTIPIVGLPQECFEGLDGKNIKLLLESAEENGICIVTAECDKNVDAADGLRVEVMA